MRKREENHIKSMLKAGVYVVVYGKKNCENAPICVEGRKRL